LRDELSQLFAAGNSTVVYATTEPTEALLLGGYTAVMDAGELLQYGPTAEVFHRPKSIRVARAFSDPPMNLVEANATEPNPVRAELVEALCSDHPELVEGRAQGERMSGAALTIGIRASALRVAQRPNDLSLPGRVELAEIAGSDTFVHVETAIGELVAQLTGVHEFTLGAPLTLYLDPSAVHVFDAAGDLLVAPKKEGI
jgi:glycerol transport system ATP-binding protein